MPALPYLLFPPPITPPKSKAFALSPAPYLLSLLVANLSKPDPKSKPSSLLVEAGLASFYGFLVASDILCFSSIFAVCLDNSIAFRNSASSTDSTLFGFADLAGSSDLKCSLVFSKRNH